MTRAHSVLSALAAVSILASAAGPGCGASSGSSHEPMPAREEWADEARCEEVGNLAESCRGLGDVRRRPVEGGDPPELWMPDVRSDAPRDADVEP